MPEALSLICFSYWVDSTSLMIEGGSFSMLPAIINWNIVLWRVRFWVRHLIVLTFNLDNCRHVAIFHWSLIDEHMKMDWCWFKQTSLIPILGLNNGVCWSVQEAYRGRRKDRTRIKESFVCLLFSNCFCKNLERDAWPILIGIFFIYNIKSLR